ncbi:MAG: SDR family NAD(P)-dependent oxidoreductase [Microscillaceae bacterium]
MENQDFAQKVVWITGASSGIGEALSLAFAQKKSRLVLSSRREEELQRVAKACQTQGAAEVMILPLDLAQPATFSDRAQSVKGYFGRIDMLVNNGGISQRSLAHETLLEVDRQLMEINFFGTIGLTKAVLPQMISQKSGQLVVVSSIVGKIGVPLRTAYSASKHALHGYFDALRAELWREGIRVLLVCPGFVQTSISLNALRGDGALHQQMDEATRQGLSPAYTAQKVLQALRTGKEEIIISGFREKYGLWLKKYAPRLFSRLLRKAKTT